MGDSDMPNGATRRGVFAGLGGIALVAPALAATGKLPPKPQNVVTPDQALRRLIVGNGHYVEEPDPSPRLRSRSALRPWPARTEIFCLYPWLRRLARRPGDPF